MRTRRTTLAATVAIASLALAACGGGDEADETAAEPSVAQAPEFEAGTTMAQLSEQGSIRVGTKFDQPGFGLENLEGDVEGFDVEVAKIVAGGLGIAPEDIEFVETPSAVREEVLEGDEVDMVVATYTINDQRKERVSFAGPYYVAGQQIMVASDNDTITGPESFRDNPDASVCSVTGSTPSENIREYLVNEQQQLVLFEEYSQCADALSNGQVDAVTTDNVILLGFVSESDGAFKLVGEQFTEEPYGIGIPKGDVAFCEFVNETLAANPDAYAQAWESTAGQVEGAETPPLPEPAPFFGPAGGVAAGPRRPQPPARLSSEPREEKRVDAVTDNLDLFVEGYLTSLTIILWALAGALPLGVLIAACRVSPVPPLQKFGTFWVTTFRNTPLTVVLFFCAFGLPELGINRTFFSFGVLGLVLYTSAFVCEAVRSGINSVPAGQAEAARSIGLNFTQGLRFVVLPQALRTVVPPLGSVLIAMFKNSAVVGAFGVGGDLWSTGATLTSARGYETLPVFVGVAIGYLCITLPAGALLQVIERKVAIAR